MRMLTDLQKRIGFSFAIPVIAIIAMVSGCGALSNSGTAVLWTNKSEIAAYIELFNTEQNSYKIEVVYKNNPSIALKNESSAPDIVIGENLNNGELSKFFSSLDNQIEKEIINTKEIYPELLKLGQREDKQFLLPVSFCLPAIIFRSEDIIPLADSFIITLDGIRSLSTSFGKENRDLSRTGFSPRWQPEMSYIVAYLFGAGFHETPEGLPAWNDFRLIEAIDFIRNWTIEINGGIEAENAFVEKYMYDPGYKLVNSGRIRFYYTDICDFQIIPAEIRDSLDFTWLSDGTRIQVGDQILYMGMTKQAKNRRAAAALISWFFMPETQSRLLESAQFSRMRVFGIAGGFSSLEVVNTSSLPRYFPFLLGHVPGAESLKFPSPLPVSWPAMKRDVVFPWLLEISGTGEQIESLAERLRTWQLQHPEVQ